MLQNWQQTLQTLQLQQVLSQQQGEQISHRSAAPLIYTLVAMMLLSEISLLCLSRLGSMGFSKKAQPQICSKNVKCVF